MRGRKAGGRNREPIRPEMVARVLELRGEGVKFDAIGAELGVTAQAVHYLAQRWRGWEPSGGQNP